MRWTAGTGAGLLMSILFLGSAFADFADGARAYDSGDYVTAFNKWHSLAATGDPAAQVALASLHRNGTGRPVDLVQAAYWYRRAAEQGNAVGQMNLGEMYQHGWGVTRSMVRAFIWYDRAARQGRGWAAEQRDNLVKGMTVEQLRQARSMR